MVLPVVFANNLDGELMSSSSNQHVQFAKIQSHNYSMFQMTMRCADALPCKHILIVTHIDYCFTIAMQLIELKIENKEIHIIWEPKVSGTFVSTIISILEASRYDAETMLILPSDRHYTCDEVFKLYCHRAIDFVSKKRDMIAILGKLSTKECSNYRSAKLDDQANEDYRTVRSFCKKSSNANDYIEEASYYRSLGVVCINIDVLQNIICDLRPNDYEAMRQSWQRANRTSNGCIIGAHMWPRVMYEELDDKLFPKLNNIVMINCKDLIIDNFEALDHVANDVVGIKNSSKFDYGAVWHNMQDMYSKNCNVGKKHMLVSDVCNINANVHQYNYNLKVSEYVGTSYQESIHETYHGVTICDAIIDGGKNCIVKKMRLHHLSSISSNVIEECYINFMILAGKVRCQLDGVVFYYKAQDVMRMQQGSSYCIENPHEEEVLLLKISVF